MNNDEKILKAIETLQADLKDVKQGQGRLEKDLQAVQQSQAQTNTTLGQVKTLVEATAAGQKELQETTATRADVLRVGVKVDSLRKRIEGIEEHTGSSTHKN
jgi:predicted  nucleic acid-binding Zn-ribbon protein